MDCNLLITSKKARTAKFSPYIPCSFYVDLESGYVIFHAMPMDGKCLINLLAI